MAEKRKPQPIDESLLEDLKLIVQPARRLPNPITTEGFSLAKAARAAGITNTRLTFWLARDQIKNLDADRVESGYRKFSYVDVGRLALTARLVNYGLEIESASTIVEQMVGPVMRTLSTYKNTPPAAIALALSQHAAVIWFDETAGAFQWDFLRNVQSLPEIFISFNIAKIIERTFDILKEVE